MTTHPSARRIPILAAGCILALAQGCMSYRATSRPLKLDDRVRVTSTEPFTVDAAGHSCLAREVRGMLVSARADTLTLRSPLEVKAARGAPDCEYRRTVTLVVPARGAEVGVERLDVGGTLLLVSMSVLVGFAGFMIIAIATDPS